MEIKTEKTHTVIMTDSELNTLRCFIGDAIDDYEVWDHWKNDQAFIRLIHEKALSAVLGGGE